MSSKLTSLAKSNNISNVNDFEAGFKMAFNVIDESLIKELNKVNEYPWMGERIMTLKLYKAKIINLLRDMEQEYE